MDWQNNKCPICKNEEADRKEIEQNKFLYKCQNCGNFCISRETLELKKDFIRDNWQKISAGLKNGTNANITTEIVFHEEKIKIPNQKTFEMLVK